MVISDVGVGLREENPFENVGFFERSVKRPHEPRRLREVKEIKKLSMLSTASHL